MGIISHVHSITIPDGSNTDIVRPIDWNSVHAYTLQDAVSLAGNTTGTLSNISSGTFLLAGGNNITLSQNGNNVTISCFVNTLSLWPDILPATTQSTYYSGSTSQGAAGASTQSGHTYSIYLVPCALYSPIAFSNLRLGLSNATAAGTGSVTHNWSFGFYTNNASTLSLVTAYYGGIYFSQNSATAQTYSIWTASTTVGGAGSTRTANHVSSIQSSQGNAIVSNISALKYNLLNATRATTLQADQYYIAFAHNSISTSTNVYSNVGYMQSSNITAALVEIGVNPVATQGSLPGWGAISTTFTQQNTTATFFPLPNAIALSNMSSNSTAFFRYHFPMLRGI